MRNLKRWLNRPSRVAWRANVEAVAWWVFGVFAIIFGWSEILTLTFAISIHALYLTARSKAQAARAQQTADPDEENPE